MFRLAARSRISASLVATLALLAGLVLSVGSAAAQTPGYAYRPGEILIKFTPGTSAADIQAVLSDLGATRITAFRLIGASHERITRLSVEEAITRYRGDHRVQYIEPNYVLHALETPDDPMFDQLWGMKNTGQTGGTPGADIHATQAWDIFTGSSSVLVAIIDTGMDYNHPDLAANVFVNPGEIPDNGVDDDGNGFIDDVRGWDFANNDHDPMDDHGHGTHVSGTVGAIGDNGVGVVGVNWSVKLLPVKFLDAGGSGSDAGAISSIDYATLMNVRVMSNSWGGGGYSQAMYDAIQAAGAAGIVFVAAAGNASSNNDVTPAYPASYDLPNIIAVAASDPNDNLAYFSNFGVNSVDLAAPGTDILSTFPGAGYGYLSGTSMATPHVSGAVALIMGRFPAINGSSARDLLLARVDPVPSLAGQVATGGRLNAFLPIAEPDTLPPAPIGDLAILQLNGDWAELQWTATGDDGATGTASRYDVRYSTAPITEATFGAATPAAGAPDPLPAGSTEQMRVNGLSFSTGYYFAVKALDELGNPSGISNLATGTTLGPPDVGVAPSSLSADLLTGEKSTQVLTISNTGASELRFEVKSQPPAGAASIAAADPPPTAGLRHAPPARMAEAGWQGSTAGPAYSAGHTPPRDPIVLPVPSPVQRAAAGLRILLLQSGGDVSEIRNQLLAFPDIAQVDVFDGQFATPTLDQLRAYNTVIAIANVAFGDRVGTGDVLADFIDAGGGLVLTLATFINGWEIRGRLLTGGYYPFDLGSGPAGFSTLGAFDAAHPIMQGVYAATGDLLGQVTVAAGAELVASWANGFPFVATQAHRVAAVNIFFGAPGYWTGDLPLLMRNAAFWASGNPNFVTAQPANGVVPPGGSAQVQVTFDATRLNGGDYRADLAVKSNDPDQPQMLVPAMLHVTGAPDIAVSPLSLEFGQVFIGGARSESLVVTNQGSDLLSVSTVTVTPADYAVPGAGFDLQPGARRTLIVTFAPQSAAVIPGSLEIASNDPDQPLVMVPLNGEGLVAPDIAVAPESLAASLFTGEQTEQTLTIDNTGGNDLTFDVFIESSGSGPLARARHAALPAGWSTRSASGLQGKPAVRSDQLPSGVQASPARVSFTPGAVALLIEDALPWGSTANEQILAANGIAYDVIGSAALASTQLNRYRLVIVASDQPTSTYTTLAAGAAQINGYVAGGGVLEFHAAGWGWSGGDASLVTLPGGMHIVQYGAGLNHVLDPTHPLMVGVPEPFFGTGASHAYFTDLPASAHPVASDDQGRTNLVVYRYGSGQVVTGCQTFEYGYTYGQHAGIILNNMIPYAASLGVAWLSVNPPSGTVPAGSSRDVAVKFDATGLYGGDYRAVLHVASNDPDEPDVPVPAHLHVTGAPDIAVSKPDLDFGQVFTGYSRAETLVVINQGTDLLSVSGVSATPAEFAAPAAGFGLQPGESRMLIVTFSPQSVAVLQGSLEIASNDPDQPLVTVPLQGEGLIAPDIEADPSSLNVALLSGENTTRPLTLRNTGGSALNFAVSQRATMSSANRPGALAAGVSTGAPRPARSAALAARPVQAVHSSAAGPVTAVSRPHTAAPGVDRSASQPLATPDAILAGNDLLVLTTASIDNSVLRALQELGHSYDLIYTQDFTGIDFTPYHTIVVALDGGIINQLSCQAIANAAAGGRLLFIIGGTSYDPYYNGVQTYLLSHTGQTGWTISAPPHLTVVNPADLLAEGLPATTTYVEFGAAYYMLRINDPAAPVAAINGDNHPALVHKPIGTGNLVYFVSPPDDFFWWNAADYAILKQIVKNALAFGPAPWLTVLPQSGTVPAGGEVTLQVGFDAAGLNGGDYLAEIRITSNDPDESPLVVPTGMHVTGAPDIAVSETSLDYGELFIGVSRQDSVVVSNQGSDLLTVSSVTASPGDFGVPGGGFSLAPGQNHALIVTFAPQSAGPIQGSLDITSDDPDEGQVTVALNGVGLVPPDIEVTPASLDTDLEPGRQVTQPLTLGNLGGSPLQWSITVQGAASAPSPSAGGAGAAPHAMRSVGTGAVAWVRQDGADLASPSGASGLESMLRHRLEVLSPQTIVFFDDMEHGDNGWTRQVYGVDDLWHRTTRASNSPVTSWWCGLESTGNYSTGNTIRTAAVSPPISLVNFSAPIALEFYESFQTEPGYDYCMVDVSTDGGMTWTPLRGGQGQAPSGDSGGWRLTVLDLSPWVGQVIRLRYYFDTIDPIANAYPGWFFDDVLVSAAGVPWLTVTPLGGSVPAGSTQPLEARFDATGLTPGNFQAEIHIASNDPDEPQVTVPAHLHVIGIPDIAVSKTSLDFGQVFIGGSRQQSLDVTNQGTDVLSLSGVTAAPADFSVPGAGFSLQPGQKRTLTVTFSPQSAAVIPGSLQIASDDPDQPLLTVPLQGEGLIPPDIAVEPESLSVTLLTGGGTTRPLTLRNTGGSNLSFTVGQRVTSFLAIGAAAHAARAPLDAARPAAHLAFAARAAPLAGSAAAGPDTTTSDGGPLPSPENAILSGNDLLVLTTTSLNNSVLKALQDLGRGYDLVSTANFTGIDFTPYQTVVVALDGGNVNAASCQALANAAAAGRLLFMLGGTNSAQFYNGVQTYLLSHTGQTGWATSAPPHLAVVNSADPLANGLPPTTTFSNNNASYYMLRINDPAAAVAVNNGDNHPALVYKPIGAGSLIYFINSPHQGYWGNSSDYAILKQVVENALASGRARWLSIEPQSGTVPAGGAVTLQVGFNATGLAAGYYRAEMRIASNDPDEPLVAAPASLMVESPTAADVALVSSSAEPGVARVVWYAAQAGAMSAAVHRRTADTDWSEVGPIAPDGEGYLRFEDREVAPGKRYGYRLGITEDGALRFVGETWVEVPWGGSLALHGMEPNPALRDLTVAFSLPDAQPATLELLDLAGRRLRQQDVGASGAGRHVVSLGRTASLPAGLYLVRLQRGDRTLVAKCVIMQ